MLRKSGLVSRVVDLKIDRAAEISAKAVGEAENDGGVARFLARFLDHLHDRDNVRYGLGPLDYPDPDNPGRRRRRRGV